MRKNVNNPKNEEYAYTILNIPKDISDDLLLWHFKRMFTIVDDADDGNYQKILDECYDTILNKTQNTVGKLMKRADDLSMRRQIREIQVKNNITPVEYTKEDIVNHMRKNVNNPKNEEYAYTILNIPKDIVMTCYFGITKECSQLWTMRTMAIIKKYWMSVMIILNKTQNTVGKLMKPKDFEDLNPKDHKIFLENFGYFELMPSELEKLNMAKDNYNNGEITEQDMNDFINGLHAMGYGIVVGFINYVIDNPSNQSFDDRNG